MSARTEYEAFRRIYKLRNFPRTAARFHTCVAAKSNFPNDDAHPRLDNLCVPAAAVTYTATDNAVLFGCRNYAINIGVIKHSGSFSFHANFVCETSLTFLHSEGMQGGALDERQPATRRPTHLRSMSTNSENKKSADLRAKGKTTNCGTPSNRCGRGIRSEHIRRRRRPLCTAALALGVVMLLGNVAALHRHSPASHIDAVGRILKVEKSMRWAALDRRRSSKVSHPASKFMWLDVCV